ncbi:RNA 2',3'-cyclic phosphodiesterase [Candidatus Uhrbacteria bacterium]|nr:RNA 2',3'-cyclic phosphodiesterase [Candidatus Uhrbacteria bacterium]MBD3284207.1 RNA 2',3'-cyclic phosphodiesterase [Candidatus Uhrbacteria bacterium]
MVSGTWYEKCSHVPFTNQHLQNRMRCFLGIMLEEELRDTLSEVLISAEKPSHLKRVDESLWHMTLVFLGEVEPDRIRDVIRICSYYRKRPGTFVFNKLEAFPAHSTSPRLIAANGLLQPIEGWRRYVKAIRKELLPYAPNMDRKEWISHVTLAKSSAGHQLPKWNLPMTPYRWEPSGFHLIHSKHGPDGVTYQMIHEFPYTN